MKIRTLKIHTQTSDGPYGATLDFPDGLIVVWADNSMGKSTCVKSILIALGMEAMLTTNQSDLPLPPAIKARLESNNGEHDVLESEVFLEIENTQGERIVAHRMIKGSQDKNLVTVHEGPALTQPEKTFATRDFFVNRSGSATRTSGFHHFLAQFIGLDIPEVTTYDGKTCPLYLQCIFPYFIVEQTRGWSTVQPPLPTHFRIRDPHKRVIEFLLNLDAHKLAITRQGLLFRKNRIEIHWSNNLKQASELAISVAGTINAVPKLPVTMWPPQILPSISVPKGELWTTLNQRILDRQHELNQLFSKEIPRVQEVVESTQTELELVEQEVRDQQALLSRLLDALEMEEQEIDRIKGRLSVIDEDIQRNKDVRTLKSLGSRKNSYIEQGVCPVCHQTIQDSLVPLAAEQVVMSIDENIQFLTEQRRTYQLVLSNAQRVADARASQVRELREKLSSLRGKVRVLRQTLVSDERMPSVAAIHARIELENALKKDRETQEKFSKLIDGFADLSEQWRVVIQEIHNLPKDDISESDKRKINLWTNLIRTQLAQYQFMSFPVNQVLISYDNYRPECDGFDLQASLSLEASISASDLIRTIWAYLHGMMELSRTEDTNHPGLVIFDEPRQQSTRDVSFGELMRRAATAVKFNQQVIFFTSENKEQLNAHLSGLPHTLLPIDGRVLKRL
jgi:hypothetical protein